jgi:hypothetical protein
MKPIVVAMEVDSKGIPVKEAFVVISEFDTVEDTVKRLTTEFKSGAFKSWSGKSRVSKAQGAIDRGNKLVFKASLF